ncbi:MAG: hypothetical protein MI757_02330 [Pirellulales bacterium]|nr:hypothetical protein [Pirellulales bacterium]
MTHVGKFAAICSLLFVCAVFVDTKAAEAQVVTTYYAPAPAVSYVPVRRGIFGWRVGYRPVVTYPAPVVAAPTIVAPPVTTYYRAPVVAPTVVAPPVTTYYRAPVVVPQRVYYAPAPVYVYP